MITVCNNTIKSESDRILSEINLAYDQFEDRPTDPISLRGTAERLKRAAVEVDVWADKIEHLQQSPDFRQGE